MTTGEVARFCGVNFRTVIRWIERGHLNAYKLPGRGDNRVPVADFIRFLESNQMPVPEALLPQQHTLLIRLESHALIGDIASLGRCAGWEPVVAASDLQLGYLLGKHSTAALIVDNPHLPDTIERLLTGQNRAQELRICLCHQTEVEKMCAGWHIVSWPSEQPILMNLLSEFSPVGTAGNDAR